MTQLEEIVASLESLGSVEAIAEFLESEGIKGERVEAQSCPVSNYIRREMNVPYVGTTWSWVSVIADVERYEETGEGKKKVAFPLGSCLSAFVEEFDQRGIPALEANRDS